MVDLIQHHKKEDHLLVEGVDRTAELEKLNQSIIIKKKKPDLDQERGIKKEAIQGVVPKVDQGVIQKRKEPLDLNKTTLEILPEVEEEVEVNPEIAVTREAFLGEKKDIFPERESIPELTPQKEKTERIIRVILAIVVTQEVTEIKGVILIEDRKVDLPIEGEKDPVTVEVLEVLQLI